MRARNRAGSFAFFVIVIAVAGAWNLVNAAWFASSWWRPWGLAIGGLAVALAVMMTIVKAALVRDDRRRAEAYVQISGWVTQMRREPGAPAAPAYRVNESWSTRRAARRWDEIDRQVRP